MKWEKKGLIWAPDGTSDWMNNSVLQPTPLIKGNVIRIYAGFRTKEGVGRPGYIDLDANDPSRVLDISKKPLFDIGEPGCFDDNGAVPCAVTRVEDKVYMFYGGYNIGYHVRFTAFTGLAISEDDGDTFVRQSRVPVMDRTENERLFRAIHTALYEDGRWRLYYGAGNVFIQGKNKTLPVYEVYTLLANDIEEFNQEGEKILANKGNEHRLGRPYVLHHNGMYEMYFGYGSEAKPYQLGYAESLDGVHWDRKDEALGLELSSDGWDSQMMAYPSVVYYRDKKYLFYNGNNYGYDGFGYAELLCE